MTRAHAEASVLHGALVVIDVRHEVAGDSSAIADINDRAFSGRDESRIIEAIRESGQATISLVATLGSASVGHILFSPVRIESPGSVVAALGLGPMAVLPHLQRQGIGTRLVQVGLQECARQGCQAVVVLGHPHFYQRFGFRPASAFGLRSEYPDAGDAFMAMELADGVLSGRTGVVKYLPEFSNEV